MGTKVSLLELGIVAEGKEIPDALTEVVANAQKVESLGFERVWIAEHHNSQGISTAATAVLIGHVAGKTKSIRVGSGGIMLPNHSPLVVAEQFGTLDILYPNRIDLGLGRAPGTDQLTAAALRRNNLGTAHEFPADIIALQNYFSSENSTSKVRAFPGEGRNVPLYILGSSTESAYLAAELGLPYAFASHFAPAYLFQAIEIYKTKFKPSEYLKQPYLMVAANVLGADTAEEALLLKSSLEMLIFGLLTNQPRKLSPPTADLPAIIKSPEAQRAINGMIQYTFTGDKILLREELSTFIGSTGADELIITGYVYDRKARFRSYEVIAEALSVNPG